MNKKGKQSYTKYLYSIENYCAIELGEIQYGSLCLPLIFHGLKSGTKNPKFQMCL